MRIAALVHTTRPSSSLVAGALATAAATGGARELTSRGVAAGLTMTALAMFGFVVNDIFDHHKDTIAGVRRPVATGELSRESAGRLAAGLLLAASLFSAAVGSGGLVLVGTGAALLLYSPVSMRFPLSKDGYVAALVCAVMWYGTLAAGVPRSWPAYAALACFVFGREVLMDSDELAGDSRAGLHTIAWILGRQWTTRVGITFMLAAAAVTVAIVRGPFVTGTAAGVLIILAFLLTWPGLDDGARIRWSRAPMILGAVALGCGG
jgi:4-hydroxybenzoate polyprenyltransferase